MHLCLLSIRYACIYHNSSAAIMGHLIHIIDIQVHLGLWAWLDVQKKISEKPLGTPYGKEMNINFTGNSSGEGWNSQHANRALTRKLGHLWHCAVCDQTARFKVALLLWPI